jgi:putative ABC transport system ATP-binding protein
MIKLVNVEKSYDAGRTTALSRLNLTIGRGENVSIMGRSGSGKSTLLNLLSGLDRPDAGEIWLDDELVSEPSQWTHLRASKIGIVFQHFCLLPDFTARENIEIAMLPKQRNPQLRRRRVEELIESFSLARVASQFPPTLSGGERQRVAIARAIVNRPLLLLADEPTGNLDTATGNSVMEMLRTLNANDGCILIMVTHDPALAAQASRQIALEDGLVTIDSGAKSGAQH